MRASDAYPPAALSAGDVVATSSWGIAEVVRTKLTKLAIKKMRTQEGFIASRPHCEHGARGIGRKPMTVRLPISFLM